MSFQITREILLVLSCAIAHILLTHKKRFALLIRSVHSMKIQEESSNSQILAYDRADCLIVDFLDLLLSPLIDSVGLKTDFVFLTSSQMTLMLMTQRDLLKTYWSKVTNDFYSYLSPAIK